jgi:hypothetical protein
MYAQLTYFDGPRSPELVAASDRAIAERIQPAIEADPEMRGQLVATYVLRDADGGEVVVTIAQTEEALRHGQSVIMGTTLLPGEDPALLPGPDRVEIRPVVRSFVGV